MIEEFPIESKVQVPVGHIRLPFKQRHSRSDINKVVKSKSLSKDAVRHTYLCGEESINGTLNSKGAHHTKGRNQEQPDKGNVERGQHASKAVSRPRITRKYS